MKLLLLSNSTNFGEPYFKFAQEKIAGFLAGRVKSALFIPYAVVSISYDEYEARVQEAFKSFGVDLQSIHRQPDPAVAVQKAECLVVGGGNTFHLLNQCYQNGILELIEKKAREGTTYIGWSAGSNLACPTIMTTNDMPVVEPPSLKALNLIPFQINAHYTESVIPGHGGESRDQRLLEFVQVNQDVYVVGLPEGTHLEIMDDSIKFAGKNPAKVFRFDLEPRLFYEDHQFDFLWQRT